jgi:hypothetical protein
MQMPFARFALISATLVLQSAKSIQWTIVKNVQRFAANVLKNVAAWPQLKHEHSIKLYRYAGRNFYGNFPVTAIDKNYKGKKGE